MTQPGTFTPYTTVSNFLVGQKPTWIPDELDIARIQAYQTYEEMYWNVADVFKVSLRGSNELPIYVPSARTIVDATNRYTSPAFAVAVSASGGAATADMTLAATNLEAFMRRERFRSKFNGSKRYGIIRGDWVWHVTGDPTKPEGSRISIRSLDPGMYFPITDDDDVDQIIGVHLVETTFTDKGDPIIRRLTYRKADDGTITVEDGLFETDAWSGPKDRPIKVLQDVTPLPPQITSIPVYHVKNTDSPGDPFGSSELRGLEVIMGAIDQTMSDEDLTLALDGIGVYATDASRPINPETKKPTNWEMGPGRVVHHDGQFFQRVSGVGSVTPYGDHYNRLWESLKMAASTPDIAIGAVDVNIASSGIALALQLSPMLAKAGEKNQMIVDVHNQLFFDWLTMWEPAYEGNTYDAVVITCTPGDAVPVDTSTKFAELNDMLDRGVIDTEYYRQEASKLGYTFPEGIGARATAEFNAKNAAAATADPFNTQLADETAPA